MAKQFEIVSDELRAAPSGARGRGRKSEVTLALLDGKTVLLPDGKAGGGGYATTLKHAGFRLRQTQRPEGLVLWAEPIEPDEPAEPVA
jgi:hypothetical protein